MLLQVPHSGQSIYFPPSKSTSHPNTTKTCPPRMTPSYTHLPEIRAKANKEMPRKQAFPQI